MDLKVTELEAKMYKNTRHDTLFKDSKTFNSNLN